MCRGIERREIFRDNQDRRNFVDRLGRVAELFNVTVRDILEPSKRPQRVRARSLLCFWAVTEWDLAGTVVGKRWLVQLAVRKAVERGDKMAAQHGFSIEDC
jgi:putative transposase